MHERVAKVRFPRLVVWFNWIIRAIGRNGVGFMEIYTLMGVEGGFLSNRVLSSALMNIRVVGGVSSWAQVERELVEGLGGLWMKIVPFDKSQGGGRVA